MFSEICEFLSTSQTAACSTDELHYLFSSYICELLLTETNFTSVYYY